MFNPELVKTASARQMADGILKTIYDENPDHWPHGLSADHFDGGLYLIRKSAGYDPVGFVGWQERWEQPHRVGYYSIGVLPEHRKNGFAKEAVSKLISKKAAGVDRVKALIITTNKPSMGLAEKLGVEISPVKQAHIDEEGSKKKPIQLGEISPEEVEGIKENLPDPWVSALLTGLTSGTLSAGGTAAINQRLGPEMGTAALFGGGAGALLGGGAQYFENKRMRETLDMMQKMSNDKKCKKDEYWCPTDEVCKKEKDRIEKEPHVKESKKSAGMEKQGGALARGAQLGSSGLGKGWQSMFTTGRGIRAGERAFAPWRSKLMTYGAGPAAGYGVGELENRTLFKDFDPETKNINKLMWMLSGGALMGSKSRNIQDYIRQATGASAKGLRGIPAVSSLATSPLIPAITLKQLGIAGMGYFGRGEKQFEKFVSEQEASATKNLEAAEARERAAEIDQKGNAWYDIKNWFEENPKTAWGTTAGLGGTVLGAYLYNALKKPNKPKPGIMSVEIPEGKVRDRFYTNISRNMLFQDKPKKLTKKQVLELENKEEKDEKKTKKAEPA